MGCSPWDRQRVVYDLVTKTRTRSYSKIIREVKVSVNGNIIVQLGLDMF